MSGSTDRLIEEATASLLAESSNHSGLVSVGIAPARVELLGNHTDYNGGLVMSAAINRYTVVAGRPAHQRTAHIQSLNLQDSRHFSIDQLAPEIPTTWTSYVKGVIWAIREIERSSLTDGFEVVLHGDIPIGAGLSSSASLQAAFAMFLLRAGLIEKSPRGDEWRDLSDLALMDLAKVLQYSENEYVGVASGLMDQFSVLMGRTDHALRLDCRDLSFERLPLGDPPPAIVICDSGTSRRLADGMYNRRRSECETVLNYFQELRGTEEARWLRDLTIADLDEHWDRLDPIGRRRARHVLTENERVREGADALQSGKLSAFGRVMSASHASSRDDFGNSSTALDALIDAAETAPGFFGGKLSGAGWAGCTVNLVEVNQVEAFSEAVRTAYARRIGLVPKVHACRAAGGATSVHTSRLRR
jgi:galactokinase